MGIIATLLSKQRNGTARSYGKYMFTMVRNCQTIFQNGLPYLIFKRRNRLFWGYISTTLENQIASCRSCLGNTLWRVWVEQIHRKHELEHFALICPSHLIPESDLLYPSQVDGFFTLSALLVTERSDRGSKNLRCFREILTLLCTSDLWMAIHRSSQLST